jgi:periplasmic protein TonB
MNDPVSAELEQRARLDLPWRWAVAGAVCLHLAVAGVLLLSPAHGRRALTLPSVEVRIVAAPLPGAARGGAPPTRAAAPRKPQAASRPARTKPVRTTESVPRHVAANVTTARSAPLPRPAGTEPETPAAATAAAPGGAAGGAGSTSSASGGIALGAGGAGEEPFPFSYYLNRVLAVIEGNWFRPPAAAGTVCQVRCVIDRSGRLAEAGLESASASPAFDRAALRAVYAAAPFPPLPEGFGGTELTLHLEFGP